MRILGPFASLFVAIWLFGAPGAHCRANDAKDPAKGGDSPGAAQAESPTKHWWNDAVFYEVYVRSFKDSSTGDLAGDGIGDIPGLIEALDYLNDGKPETNTDLGVTALWLMPVFEGPSVHGYETTDYFSIESEYGKNEDFKRLILECHRRGMRVIIDLTLNHTSQLHPWFRNAADPSDPKHDWFIFSRTKPLERGPWGQEVWFSQERHPGWFYYAVFSGYMPDLNYRNPEVSREMTRVTEFWLKEFDVDGYRLDAIRHLIEVPDQPQGNTTETHQWLRAWRKNCRTVKPDMFALGEVWASTDVSASYVGDEMDACFDFLVSFSITDSINLSEKQRIASALVQACAAYPRNQFATFLSNHDQTRVITRFGNDSAKAKLAASMLLTLPGIPFIYYGEEIGQTGDKPDENLRTPMQWSEDQNAGFSIGKPWRDPQPDFPRRNVRLQEADPNSLLNVYKKLIRLRQKNPALARGDYTPLETSDKGVYAFARTEGDQTIIVLANLSDKPVQGCRIRAATGSFGEVAAPRELLQTGAALNPAAPRVVGKGGIADYVPVNLLAPRSVYALDVSAK